MGQELCVVKAIQLGEPWTCLSENHVSGTGMEFLFGSVFGLDGPL